MSTIKIHLTDALTGEAYTIVKEYSDTATLASLLVEIGDPNAELDLSRYHSIGYGYCPSNVPYNIKKNCVHWYENYSEVTVKDFLATHNIVDEIYFYTGIPQAGGPDMFTIVELWEKCYPYLDQLGTCIGLIGGLLGFGEWLIRRFGRKVSPITLVDFVTSKEKWNHFILAELLQIDADEAKLLLKSFGYRWDQSIQCYCSTEKTKEVCKSLGNIKYHKDGE